LAKLKSNLILSIPPQYQKFWIRKDDVDRTPMALENIPLSPVVGFSFFLPDFSGYTPNNYQITFDPDRVDVVSLEASDVKQAEPDAPGAYPPNMMKRLLKAGVKGTYQEMYGLKCYHGVGQQPDVLTCYGPNNELYKEDIMLEVYVPPYTPGVINPTMQAMYFTKRYGGLQIIWNTSNTNFPRWHDIDAQIWKYVESWNIARSSDLYTDSKLKGSP